MPVGYPLLHGEGMGGGRGVGFAKFAHAAGRGWVPLIQSKPAGDGGAEFTKPHDTHLKISKEIESSPPRFGQERVYSRSPGPH